MPTDSASTRDRLLRAACRLFAKKGFHEATVAEICEAADANIASINYHFGDKEALYDEVWRHAFALAATAHPLDENQPPTDSLEEAIRRFANALLHRIFSDEESGLFAELLYHEMANPTLALDRIAREALLPQNEYLDRLLRVALGPDCDDATLLRCKHSIIGQCAFYNFSRPLRERVIGKASLTEDETGRLARHIARFSLGGLQAIKEPCPS